MSAHAVKSPLTNNRDLSIKTAKQAGNMMLGYKYRIYLSEEQQVKLKEMFEASRLIYNVALAYNERQRAEMFLVDRICKFFFDIDTNSKDKPHVDVYKKVRAIRNNPEHPYWPTFNLVGSRYIDYLLGTGGALPMAFKNYFDRLKKGKPFVSTEKKVVIESKRGFPMSKKELYGYPSFKKKGEVNTLRADTRAYTCAKELRTDGKLWNEENAKSKHVSVGSVTPALMNQFVFAAPTHEQQIFVYGLGWIRIRMHRELPSEGQLKQFTISRNSQGKYYISLLVDLKASYPIPPSFDSLRKEEILGIDLGLSHFAILSTGEKLDNPRLLKQLLAKKKKLQKHMDTKMQNGRNASNPSNIPILNKLNQPIIYKDGKQKMAPSNRSLKFQAEINKLDGKVRDQRNTFIAQMAAYVTSRPNIKAVALEDLNVSGMLKNNKLSLAISDVGWRMFREMVEHRCRKLGLLFLLHDRFEASSSKCSNCDYNLSQEEKAKFTLSTREWDCSNCGTHHDRDINAALNIRNNAKPIK